MMDRRRFLAQAGIGAAAAAGAAMGLSCAEAGEAPKAGPSGGKRARVVVLRDEAFKAEKPTPKTVRPLLDRAVSVLDAEKKPADAWARHFRPTDRVGIKVNCLGLPTSPAVALALAEAIQAAEVPPESVLVWDRFNRELHAAGYELRGRGSGIRCFGTDALASRGKGGYAARIAVSGEIGSLYSRIVTDETTALASAPVLKDHNLAGLSCGMKNFYGAIHNPNKYHDNGCSPFVADVCAHAYVRDRLRLVVCDATRPQYHGGPPRRGRWQWPYGGILVGTDPVAVDAVAAAILERKRRVAGMKPLAEEGRPVRYLVSGAQRGLGTADLKAVEVVSVGKPWLETG